LIDCGIALQIKAAAGGRVDSADFGERKSAKEEQRR